MLSTGKNDNRNTNINDVDDDEPDEWDRRIINTGCYDENFKLHMCYADTKDWRLCTKEMEEFKNCWKQHGNDERTHTTQNK